MRYCINEILYFMYMNSYAIQYPWIVSTEYEVCALRSLNGRLLDWYLASIILSLNKFQCNRAERGIEGTLRY